MPTGLRRRTAACRLGGAALVAAATLAVAPRPAFAVAKIGIAPATFTVTEGNTQGVVFTLSEPIIGPGPGTADLTLSFTIGDPSRLSILPATLHWDASEWAQPRTLQVTAIHDGVHDQSNSVSVQVLATSASAYYSGYTTSFAATIGDIDPAPTTTTTTTTVAPTTTIAPASTIPPTSPPSTVAGAQLAMTGGPVAPPTFAGLGCVAGGALLLAIGRSRRRWRRGDRHP